METIMNQFVDINGTIFNLEQIETISAIFVDKEPKYTIICKSGHKYTVLEREYKRTDLLNKLCLSEEEKL